METLILEEKQKEMQLEDEVGTLTLKKMAKSGGQDILVIILLEKNVNFKNFIKPYDLNVCGKKMWEWVALAASPNKIKTTTCTEETDILSLIKPLLENQKYTVVLYSSTPLLKKSTFQAIIDYVESKNVNVLKLTKGFVFNTEYIKNANDIQVGQSEYFDEEDFMTATDLKQLSYITDIMQQRIIDYHLKNGIYFEDIQNVRVDADVIIELGTRIMANNAILGRSIIGKNCLIDYGNIIDNSIISEGCILRQSYISESRISEFITVGPFETIVKQST